MKTYVFTPDRLMMWTPFGSTENPDGLMVGHHDREEHGDDADIEPHHHWSILDVEDGVVVGTDWGYHSLEEARQYAEMSAHAD